MRAVEDIRRGTSVREVPEESLTLTGDEKIVDVDFSVFWKVSPSGVGDYLFNIQNSRRNRETLVSLTERSSSAMALIRHRLPRASY